MSLKKGKKAFVKLHGPINFAEDSDDDLAAGRKEKPPKKAVIATNQTPKSNQGNANRTPIQTPATEVVLSSIDSSTKVITPRKSPNSTSKSSYQPRSPTITPKQQLDRIQTSSLISHDDKTNYSTILKNKSPVVARNTRDASIDETYRQMYSRLKVTNAELLHQKMYLELELRHFKLENQQKLAKQRESNASIEEKLEKANESAKKMLMKGEKKLASKLALQHSDEKYVGVIQANSKVKADKEAFEQLSSAFESLNSLMHYSTNESDFRQLIATCGVSGEIGEKFVEFLTVMKSSIAVLET